MRQIRPTKKFDRDLKRIIKRGKPVSKLKKIITILQTKNSLDKKYKNHPLAGNWFPYWECHIEPDWLLIYQITETEVRLIRTGTHSDLF
ncbi:mRNA interferase YafQ [hydrothermal vent metagenome]|uniref:mRNA interferase YafQ n=1 Tax=hydrothermal vent metagenome TaxID=652676 RepID=A0A3B1E0G3_9ZZZZ